MEFHASRGKVILFGGKGDVVLGETWSWDGTSWSQVTNVGNPAPRTAARMAYDQTNNVLVMFGGCTGSCGGTTEFGVDTVVNDTYTLDGGQWLLRTPTKAPSARCCVGMAYFADGVNKVILFGGADQTKTYGDTWKWDPLHNKWVCLSSC